MGVDWGERAAWDHRWPEFRSVFEYTGGERPIPAMTFVPQTAAGGHWNETRELWRTLPDEPHVLRALSDDLQLLTLRYAALHWKHGPVEDAWPFERKRGPVTLATWGLQLVRVFLTIRDSVERDAWRYLMQPFAAIDLGGDVRVGFLPVSGAPPPERDHDERSLVFVVGRLLSTFVTEDNGSIHAIIGRCTERKPRKRFESLAALEERLQRVRPDREMRCLRDGVRHGTWQHVEEGVGWLTLGNKQRAEDCFRSVLTPDYENLVRWGLRQCLPPIEPPKRDPRVRMPVPATWGWRSWSNVAPRVAELERARDFSTALQLYRETLDTSDVAAELYRGRARCHIELGETGEALDYARRAVAADAHDLFSRAVLIRALLAHRQHAEALAEADYLVMHAADDGDAHYLRGKALLALGRLTEARDVFDLAVSIDPKLVEAMLLRREADRMLKQLGQVVGSQQTQIEIPESLEELRPVLLSGRTFEAIGALSQPRWAENLDAQLLLAQFVLLAGDPDGAIAIYDGLTGAPDPHRHTALIGKANVLLDQGHLESALALFESLMADQPSDLDAIEGRARALDRLGRVGEAAAEFRRFVSLASAGTDLRVRAAQMWLEHH